MKHLLLVLALAFSISSFAGTNERFIDQNGDLHSAWSAAHRAGKGFAVLVRDAECAECDTAVKWIENQSNRVAINWRVSMVVAKHEPIIAEDGLTVMADEFAGEHDRPAGTPMLLIYHDARHVTRVMGADAVIQALGDDF